MLRAQWTIWHDGVRYAPGAPLPELDADLTAHLVETGAAAHEPAPAPVAAPAETPAETPTLAPAKPKSAKKGA